MRESSGEFEVWLEGSSVVEHGPEDVDAPAGEGEDGLVVAFALASLAVVEGAAVGVAERAEGGLIEDAFEPLVAAGGAPEEADLSGLVQDWGDAGGAREGAGEVCDTLAVTLSVAVGRFDRLAPATHDLEEEILELEDLPIGGGEIAR
jgi:hypothetical protein